MPTALGQRRWAWGASRSFCSRGIMPMIGSRSLVLSPSRKATLSGRWVSPGGCPSLRGSPPPAGGPGGAGGPPGASAGREPKRRARASFQKIFPPHQVTPRASGSPDEGGGRGPSGVTSGRAAAIREKIPKLPAEGRAPPRALPARAGSARARGRARRARAGHCAAAPPAAAPLHAGTRRRPPRSRHALRALRASSLLLLLLLLLLLRLLRFFCRRGSPVDGSFFSFFIFFFRFFRNRKSSRGARSRAGSAVRRGDLEPRPGGPSRSLRGGAPCPCAAARGAGRPDLGHPDLGPRTSDLGRSDARTLDAPTSDLGPRALDLRPWTLGRSDLGPWSSDLGPSGARTWRGSRAPPLRGPARHGARRGVHSHASRTFPPNQRASRARGGGRKGEEEEAPAGRARRPPPRAKRTAGGERRAKRREAARSAAERARPAGPGERLSWAARRRPGLKVPVAGRRPGEAWGGKSYTFLYAWAQEAEAEKAEEAEGPEMVRRWGGGRGGVRRRAPLLWQPRALFSLDP